DLFSNRATHGISIYQQTLICQETTAPEVRVDYEGLLQLATGNNRLVKGRRSNHYWQPCSASKSMGLPWQPKIRMRIIAGVAERSSRSVYAASGVSGFAQLMLCYKAIR